MKRIVLTSLLSAMAIAGYCGDKSRTFMIEKLSPPERPMQLTHKATIWNNIVSQVNQFIDHGVSYDSIAHYAAVLKTSPAPDSLVQMGSNPFINTLYQAYAAHRPVVISPDMMWLLICQGFSLHINNNSEIVLTDPDSPWEDVIAEFAAQIDDKTKDGVSRILTADFSTTTAVERIASQVTLMNATQPFFNFITVGIACGIPEVTLLGTPKDWKRLVEKTSELARYDLQWWTDEIIPILEECVRASRGKIDIQFWLNMFRIHTPQQYGASDRIDGWIVKFFPYSANGNRREGLRPLNVDRIKGLESGQIPPEIVRVPVKFIDRNTNSTIPIEIWAGFFGAEQDPNNFALTPKIGWMVRRQTRTPKLNQAMLRNFRYHNNAYLKYQQEKARMEARADSIRKAGATSDEQPPALKPGMAISPMSKRGIDISINQLPPELYEIGRIHMLTLRFNGTVDIPDDFAKIPVSRMYITGKIDEAGMERIRKMFPDTDLKINDTEYPKQ